MTATPLHHGALLHFTLKSHQKHQYDRRRTLGVYCSKLKWEKQGFHFIVNIVYTQRTTSDVLDSTVSADTTSSTCLLSL